jgi:hypothetical protein
MIVQFPRACGLWALGLAVAALFGAFLAGAAVSAAYLSRVGEECAQRRAEAYAARAQALDAVRQTRGVIGDFLCAARGLCLTDNAKFDRQDQTAFGP